jgi:hypothetical protein
MNSADALFCGIFAFEHVFGGIYEETKPNPDCFASSSYDSRY